MATKLEELLVVLRADIANYEKNLKKSSKIAKTTSKKISNSMKEASRGTEVLNRSLATFSGFLAANLVTKGVQVLASAVREGFQDFRDFSIAVAEVNSILPKNRKLTKQTKDELIKFSSNFTGTAASQAKSFYQIVSAGINDVKEATDLLEVANIAAVAGITDTETAIDGLTNALAVYGSEGLTATQASDILFATVKEGKTNFSRLASTMGQVTSLAKAANVKFFELSGTLGFLTKSGISTEEAVTGVKAILAGVIKPGQEAIDTAKQYGIDLSIAAIKAKGFVGFMEDVKNKTNGNTEAFGRLFPNIRGLTGVLNIVTGDFKDFKRILDATNKSGGATKEAFKEIKKSADFQIGRATQEFKNLSLVILNKLNPIIAGTAKEFRLLFKLISKSLATETIDQQIKRLEKLKKTQEDMNEVNRKSGDNEAFFKQSQAIDVTINKLNILKESQKELNGINKTASEAAAAERELQAEAKAKADAEAEDVIQKRVLEIEEAKLRADLLTQIDAKKNKKLIDGEKETAKLTKKELLKTHTSFLKLQAAEVAESEKTEKAKALLRKQALSATGSFFGSLMTLSKGSNRQLFEFAKAASIAIATVKGIGAVVNTMESVPFPANIPLAAAQAAASAVQIQRMSSTGFRRGIDTVPGPQTRTDSVPALLQPGERVVPRETNIELKEFLAGASSLGGGANVEITFKPDEFMEFFETRLVEREVIQVSERG